MQKAFTLFHKFGLSGRKTAAAATPSDKDDMFSLRLKRLHRVQAQQAAAHVFRNRRTPQQA